MGVDRGVDTFFLFLFNALYYLSTLSTYFYIKDEKYETEEEKMGEK